MLVIFSESIPNQIRKTSKKSSSDVEWLINVLDKCDDKANKTLFCLVIQRMLLIFVKSSKQVPMGTTLQISKGASRRACNRKKTTKSNKKH